MDKYRVTSAAEERAALERLDTHGENCSDENIVEALGTSLRTVARVRHQLVTQGFQAAIDRKSQPPRPDKIRIKGDVEQKLIQLACGDPPQGRCHWTLPMLADELVVLGLVDSISTETVRQALKRTPSSPGSSRPGAFRLRPTPSTSGGWRT